MKCRSCGLEIADKAIVCYRCGTPTAETAPVRPAPVRGRPNWIAALIALVMIVLAVWLVPQTPPGTAERWGAWSAVVVVSAVMVLWLRARSRVRGPRR